jgi:trehalose/maltose hydrolase-like predicted phosphorylase
MIYCDHRNVDGVTGTTEYFDKIQNNRYSEIESILKNLSIFFKMLSIFGVSIVLLMV